MVVKVKEESTTLFDYLNNNIQNNVVTHVITAKPSPTGLIEVNLQPANAGGETLTFFVKDNRVANTIEELVNSES